MYSSENGLPYSYAAGFGLAGGAHHLAIRSRSPCFKSRSSSLSSGLAIMVSEQVGDGNVIAPLGDIEAVAAVVDAAEDDGVFVFHHALNIGHLEGIEHSLSLGRGHGGE